MPQNALPFLPAVQGGVPAPLHLASDGSLITNSNGDALSSHLNITAAAVIKAAPGTIASVLIIAPGTTSGALVINDCATTGAATTANQLLNIPYGSLTAGQVIPLNFPCAVGIVVSAVPGGGSPQYAISYK